MELSIVQVQELIKNPASRQALADAADHENRIKLHTKAVDKTEKAPPSLSKFLHWVKEDISLPADKFKAFQGLCKPPFVTNTLCKSIFDEYQKIFEARDPYFDVELLDDTMKADFKAYLHDKKFTANFREEAFEIYKTRFCSIFVIDMPAVQATLRPEPYWYEVPIGQVIDMRLEKSKDGKQVIAYAIFKQGKQVIAIDAAKYLVLEKNDQGEYMSTLVAPHILGYCPVTFLPTKSLYSAEDDSPLARKVQLSDSARDLDWLLYYKVAGQQYESYGPYPIMTVPDTDCNFTDALGNPCNGGIVSENRDGRVHNYECPVCKKNNLVGPGTVFTRPVPRSKDDPKLDKPVDITPADIQSLEYISEKIDYLEWEIYQNNVGSTDKQVTKEAVNEKQVEATVESKRNVLCEVKKDFERCEKFIVDTMGRLRYADYYVGSTVNYGDQWFFYTPAEVTEQYATAKKSNLPNYIVAEKKQQLIQTEHKNNPHLLRRAELLNMLEPWPDLSSGECVAYQFNIQYPEKFLLKLDIANFVSKFELQNGDIVTWGSALSLDKKIEKLTTILFDYASEQYRSAKPIPEPGGPGEKGKSK